MVSGMKEEKQLHKRAYEYIKKMILDDELEENEVYSETKIAGEIGVSRTPMRDAIHRLVQEGYIDIIPSRGFILHRMTVQDVEDTFQVRSAIEGYCALWIAGESESRKAKELFEKLDFALQKQKEIARTTGNIFEFVRWDNRFHILIVEYLQNEAFNQMFSKYVHRMKRLAASSLTHAGRMEMTLSEHEAILNDMRKGRTDQVYQTMLVHMETPKGMNLEDL
jgi:DNA-binding GntR family transcriptional regulator